MKSEKEIWKPVVGLEDRYMISFLGRVKRLAYEVTDSMGRHTHHSDKIMKVRISEMWLSQFQIGRAHV